MMADIGTVTVGTIVDGGGVSGAPSEALEEDKSASEASSSAVPLPHLDR